MKGLFYKLSWSILTVALFFSCSDDASEKENDFGIKVEVNKQEIYLYETVVLKLSDDSTIKDPAWKIYYKESNEAVALCTAVTPYEISCYLDTGGEVGVVVEGAVNSKKAVIRGGFTVLDDATPLNQKPVIEIGVSSESKEEDVVVSTFHSREKGVLNFLVDEEVTFDFSETTDDIDDLENLVIELDFGQGYETVEAVHKHTFTEVGQFEMRAKVTDKQEHVAEKTFFVYVSCNDDAYELVIDPSQVTVTEGEFLNFYVYNASGAVSGGNESDYRYKWDFNGDDIFDSDWLTSASIEEYTIYQDMRDVKLKVWDKGCNFVKLVNFSELDPERENFDIAWADGVPETRQQPQIPGYFFIQGDVQELAGEEIGSKTVNVRAIATKRFSAPQSEQWRVECDYRKSEDLTKATLTIKGLNHYEREHNNGLDHGFLIKIKDINDPVGQQELTFDANGEYQFENPDGVMSRAEYFTDEGYDSIDSVRYSKDGDCTHHLFLTAGEVEGTCADGAGDLNYFILIDGTYSCPVMTGTNGKKVEIKTGAFYCEVSMVDACVGGGGGGGGQPPIER